MFFVRTQVHPAKSKIKWRLEILLRLLHTSNLSMSSIKLSFVPFFIYWLIGILYDNPKCPERHKTNKKITKSLSFSQMNVFFLHSHMETFSSLSALTFTAAFCSALVFAVRGFAHWITACKDPENCRNLMVSKLFLRAVRQNDSFSTF